MLKGKKEGPVLVICAGMNGYEVDGIAIIQSLLNLNLMKSLKGTLIAIPVMNVYGLINQSGYIPDGKKLKNSFPGLEKGSFAERLAYLLSKEIFDLATHCIYLSTTEIYAKSWPHIYTLFRHEPAKQLAMAFQSPIGLNTESTEGLLSLMHKENPIPTLIYESGEARRLDFEGVKQGMRGIVKVMRKIEMIPSTHSKSPQIVKIFDEPITILSHSSGICHFYCRIGKLVKKGALIARIRDPFSTKNIEDILSPADGVVLVQSSLPIVHEGDLIFQIAEMKNNLQEDADRPSL